MRISDWSSDVCSSDLGSRWCWWQSWHAYSTPPLRADPSVTACVRDVATAPACVVAMGPLEAVMAAIGARGRPSRPWPPPPVRLRENDGYVWQLRSATSTTSPIILKTRVPKPCDMRIGARLPTAPQPQPPDGT